MKFTHLKTMIGSSNDRERLDVEKDVDAKQKTEITVGQDCQETQRQENFEKGKVTMKWPKPFKQV